MLHDGVHVLEVNLHLVRGCSRYGVPTLVEGRGVVASTPTNAVLLLEHLTGLPLRVRVLAIAHLARDRHQYALCVHHHWHVIRVAR